MAFTKSPVQDSHGVRRIPASAQPLLTSAVSGPVVAPGLINCFPLTEKEWQKNPITRIHKREGWSEYGTRTGTTLSGTFAGYSIAQSTNVNYAYVFYTFGAGLYYTNYGSATGANVLVSSTGTQNYRGTLTNAINNTNTRKIACLEGVSANCYLTLCDEDGTNVTTTALSTIVADGTRGLVFIDGYLFAVNSTGTKIYNSGAGGNLTTWATTDFLDAEQYADPIMYIEKHKNYVVAFGLASIEFFYNNAVEVGSPLARQESYASQIGLLLGNGGNFTTNGRLVAKHVDDLYFLGYAEGQSASLYRIKDFRVEKLNTPSYLQGILNSGTYGSIILHTNLINNNPCIVVELLNSGGTWAYMIDEDAWFEITGADYPQTASSIIGRPFVTMQTVGTGVPGVFAITGTNGNLPKLMRPDETVSTTATYYSAIEDFGTNRWKHLARVDVIGDFKTNAVTLAVGKSMNYQMVSGSINCGTQTQSTIGYESNMSWYNIGAFRQPWFAIGWTGGAPGIFSAIEIEYNVGVS